jgi:Ca2+-binding EF-hand superfamily protein
LDGKAWKRLSVRFLRQVRHCLICINSITDSQVKKLRECFSSLDQEGEGEIGIEALEEPLIGLGFAENRDEV